MACPLVELVDISHAANGAQLLDNISWKITAQSRWAVLGPNGAGKSTLVRIVGGLMWPNRGGQVLRNGQRLPNLRAMRRGIGWVDCELGRRVPKRESVRGLVESGRYAELGLRPPIRTETSAACAADATELMHRLGFERLQDRRFVTLSQGEQQIVLLARALMAEPLLLILDEPCAGLDPHARETFLDALSRTIEHPTISPAIILVTHHLEEVVAGIESVLLMKEGSVLAASVPAQCINAEAIERVYGRRPHDIRKVSGRYWPVWGAARIDSPS